MRYIEFSVSISILFIVYVVSETSMGPLTTSHIIFTFRASENIDFSASESLPAFGELTEFAKIFPFASSLLS